MSAKIAWVCLSCVFVLVACSSGGGPPDRSLVPAGQGWQCVGERNARGEAGMCDRRCSFPGVGADGAAVQLPCTAAPRAHCVTWRSSAGTPHWACYDIATRCNVRRDQESGADNEVSECGDVP